MCVRTMHISKIVGALHTHVILSEAGVCLGSRVKWNNMVPPEAYSVPSFGTTILSIIMYRCVCAFSLSVCLFFHRPQKHKIAFRVHCLMCVSIISVRRHISYYTHTHTHPRRGRSHMISTLRITVFRRAKQKTHTQ